MRRVERKLERDRAVQRANPSIPRRANVHDWVSILLLGAFGIMMMVVMALVILPYLEPPPLIYNNLPFPVQEPVYPGDPIPMHVDRCNNLDMPLYLESARTLRNIDTGRAYSLPSGAAVAEPGCGQATVTTSVVPEDAPPGHYVLSATVRTHGKFGRLFDISYRSQVFTVEPRPAGDMLSGPEVPRRQS